jgi:hypothetical protein
MPQAGKPTHLPRVVRGDAELRISVVTPDAKSLVVGH